jgi:hypothetical protein
MYVTAASANHFKTVKQLIKSLQGKPVIFYDIGLTDEQISDIKTLPIEYRLFDWSLVPSWGLLSAESSGAYVWKPIIIHTVLQENHSIIIWSDAGNIISDHPSLENQILSVNLYTPTSSGTIKDWTHKVCINGMDMHSNELDLQMRNAALIGFTTNDPIVRQFIDDWKSYSLRKELITGSRSNHRHDQSILSCLFYKYNRSCANHYIGFTSHNDCD